MLDFFSFRLPDDFINEYKGKESPFGFTDAGGNSLGEITFIRTYSRTKDDGTKERWYEVCRRVIEGMYSVQKNWAKENRLPWNDYKAQKSAQEAFQRMFELKWTPPGRGMWAFGTPMTMEKRNSAALQNCAMVSTKDLDKNDPGSLFAWVMDALMLGIGVGFDTLGQEKNFQIYSPSEPVVVYDIPDTREGWVESVRILLNSFLRPNQNIQEFNYSLVRPLGSPIRGFGGVASGPEPLAKLHESIRRVIGGRAGEQLDSRAIVDIVNLIGTCVVAGNVRRSATLALGKPDDKDFINLKNHEVFPERNNYDSTGENQGWAWMSNNSISAEVGTKYEDYVDLIASNGEPGFIWLDVARNFGRLTDPADGKDYRVMGFNPCITDDSWIMTLDGARQVKDLIDVEFSAIVDGKPYHSNGFWKSGKKNVYELKTSDGYSLSLTEDHKVMTDRGWIEAKDLTHSDRIRLNNHFGFSWKGDGEFDEGYVVGHWLGDGSNSKKAAILEDWYESDESAKLIEDYARTIKHRSDFSGWTHAGDSRRLETRGLSDKIFSWTKGKVVSDKIERASIDFYKGFLSGWFDTDGHVEGCSTSGGVSIRLSSTNKENLQAAQRMLLRLGIVSSIRLLREEGFRLLPDGCGSKKMYKTKTSYRLIISGEHVKRFVDTVGFINKDKANKVVERISSMSRGFYGKDFFSKVQSVSLKGSKNVYDAEVDVVHAFDANGLYVHNCAEQPLESYELCTLVEVHLNRHESKDDFFRTLKFAYLYGKTVTLLPTHWPQTNGIMQRNRRIGTSLTGIASFSDKHGLPVTREWMDDGYKTIRKYDHQYSEWLCVRESVRVTTVKPSGSVSLLSGASPGVHWTPGGRYYIRAIRFGSTDPMMPLFREAGYHIEKDIASAGTDVVYFPMSSEQKRSEKDVTLFEKIGLAATTQKYWSDNGVSVTLSFDKERETRDIAPALHMYEGQLKAVSFLPMGNTVYPQQPYTAITEEEYNAYIGKIKKIDWSSIYDQKDNIDAEGEAYCTTDTCLLP